MGRMYTDATGGTLCYCSAPVFGPLGARKGGALAAGRVTLPTDPARTFSAPFRHNSPLLRALRPRYSIHHRSECPTPSPGTVLA